MNMHNVHIFGQWGPLIMIVNLTGSRKPSRLVKHMSGCADGMFLEATSVKASNRKEAPSEVGEGDISFYIMAPVPHLLQPDPIPNSHLQQPYSPNHLPKAAT